MTEQEWQELRAQRHARVRRVKSVLRRLPRRSNVHRYPVLKWFGKAVRGKPYLWSFRISEVARALYAGCVITLLPIPGQLLLAVVAALLLRTNLTVIVGLQFISNVATFTVFIPAIHTVGRFAVNLFEPGRVPPLLKPDLNEVGALSGHISAVILGAVVLGLVTGLILHLLYALLVLQVKKRGVNFRLMAQRRADSARLDADKDARAE